MVPKEIEITSEGFVYTVPIWCEAPVTFRKEAARREEQHYGPMGNKGFFPPLMLKSVEESDHHVGTSIAGKNLNWRSRDSTREANSKGKGPLSAVAGQLERKENLGPNFLGPKRQQQKNNAAQSLDIVNIEIQANLSRITTNNRFEELGNQDTGASNKFSGDQEGRKATDKDAAQIKKKPRDSERLSEPLRDEIEENCRILMEQGREGVLIPFELGDEGNNLEFVADLSDDDDMSIIQTEERTDQEIQTVSDMQLEQKADGEGTIEDILPLNSNEHGTDTSAENEISSWVQENIIRLSIEFGVHFIGCEEVALNLFMAIDSKRQTIKKARGAIVPITPVGKVPKELKNLEPKSNFVSYGTRSRGGCFIDDLNEG
ncbi:hypothetical protein KY285_016371 [Solanum tuberosum]|nr:hypothetical protein KY284_016363 [Solanum tuberosum]KAH0702093.1 hypothetical protein KY285_016371 [Solanum tuberosum]